MKTRPKYKKSNLLSPADRERLIMEAAERANLIMTICILHDCFGFEEKEIQDFVDRYKELADSFQHGNENLETINQELWERFGVKVM